MKRKIKMLILLLISFTLVGVLVSVKIFSDKKEVENRGEKIATNNILSYYLFDKDAKEWKKQTAGSFPLDNKILDDELTNCVSADDILVYGYNESGMEIDSNIEISIADDKVQIKNPDLEVIYCDLYFKDPEPPLKDVEQYLKDVNPDGYYDELLYGLKRFRGTNHNVHNFICIGAESIEECTRNNDNIDKYMYRIIGLDDKGRTKVIKFLPISELNGDSLNLVELRIDSTAMGEEMVWTQTPIYNRLNSNNSDSIFLYYDRYMNDLWRGKIDLNHQWMKDTTQEITWFQDVSETTMNEFYIGLESKDFKYSGIGVMNHIDYFAAYYDKDNTDINKRTVDQFKTLCITGLSKKDNDMTKTCRKSWLSYGNNYLTNCIGSGVKNSFGNDGSDVTVYNYQNAKGCSDNATVEFLMMNNGKYVFLTGRGFHRIDECGGISFGTKTDYAAIRPVFFLKLNVKIAAGDGTYANPFLVKE